MEGPRVGGEISKIKNDPMNNIPVITVHSSVPAPSS